MTDRPRLLVVTNDFPPRPGGIQSFLQGVVTRLPTDQVVVLTSRWRDWEQWDADVPFTVVRQDTKVLLPTTQVRRHAVSLFREHGCTDVWFGAAAPLGLLAPALRKAGARRVVATTHGHEAGWTVVPALRLLLRRVASGVDVLTYLGEYTRSRLAAAIGPHAGKLQRLVPAVDAEQFRPNAGGASIRADLGWSDRPVVVCVSRLMPRKGQDALVEALPEIRRRVPGAALLLVGGGPARSRIEELAGKYGVTEHVHITGSVSFDRLPEYYTAGDVFAMPCRDRLRAHQLVSQCLVVGDQKPFIAALVTIDEEAFPAWRAAHGKPDSATVADLADDEDLRTAIQGAIDEANKAVSKAEAIKAFAILGADWTVDSGELTPSLKVKRNVILDRYAGEIEKLYSGKKPE